MKKMGKTGLNLTDNNIRLKKIRARKEKKKVKQEFLDTIIDAIKFGMETEKAKYEDWNDELHLIKVDINFDKQTKQTELFFKRALK